MASRVDSEECFPIARVGLGAEREEWRLRRSSERRSTFAASLSARPDVLKRRWWKVNVRETFSGHQDQRAGASTDC